MLPQVTTALWIGIVLGLALVLAGWRGRSVHRRPTCRRCRFDLTGLPGSAAVCPECGASLRAKSAIRKGVREIRWVALAPGLLLLFAPGGLMLALLVATGAGYELNNLKPTGMLLWESHLADGKRAEKIAEELYARALDGRFTEAQYKDVVDVALRYQGDWKREWSAPWSELLERAMLDRKLTPAQQRQMLNQALALDWRVRRKVAPGEKLPILLVVQEPRLPPSQIASIGIHFESAKIGGRNLTVAPGLWLGFLPAIRTTDDPLHLQNFTLGGMRSYMANARVQPVPFRLYVPEDLPPGRHRIAVTILVRSQRSLRAARRVEAIFDVYIAHPDERLVDLVPPTPQLDAELAERLVPHETRIRRTILATTAEQTFDLSNLPVDVTFDVFWRDGANEKLLGVISSSDDLSGASMGQAGQPRLRRISGGPGPIRSDRVEIVLRPNPAFAARTTDLERIYGGQIVIPDVEVPWPE